MDGATAHPAFVTPADHLPMTVMDPCSIQTGIPSFQRDRFRIRPNPNTGRFTVEFNDPLMAESFYSVYDAVGKLLYQRPLPKGRETEEIDLSSFGRGTYLIRITNRDGVCNERVVVE